MKRFFAVLLCALMLFGLVGCAKTDNAPRDRFTTAALTDEIVKIGQGSQKFDFTVTHSDKSMKKYIVSTDKETVGEALYELKIIDGENGQYGLYVKTVDGETLDYKTDGKFWSLYVDGKIASQGADFTKISEGQSFEFRAVTLN